MILIDSNIVIYSAIEKHKYPRELYDSGKVFISAITRLEDLGFHKIANAQQNYFNSLFSLTEILPTNAEIVNEAIELRRSYNQSIGDVIIAATAITKKLILYTNNDDDFNKIKNLEISNPLRSIRIFVRDNSAGLLNFTPSKKLTFKLTGD